MGISRITEINILFMKEHPMTGSRYFNILSQYLKIFSFSCHAISCVKENVTVYILFPEFDILQYVQLIITTRAGLVLGLANRRLEIPAFKL
jgi:hypothetical protein